jgi:hypothetical protein
MRIKLDENLPIVLITELRLSHGLLPSHSKFFDHSTATKSRGLS